MKKDLRVVLSVLAFLYISKSVSQPKLELPAYGNYSISVKDTIIFKVDERLETVFYSGPKPFFIKIWYPSTKATSDTRLKFGDFLTKRSKDLNAIADTMNAMVKAQIIRYAFASRFYGPSIERDFTELQMYEELLKMPVKSARNLPILAGKLPCVFYHHGANSFSFDNYLFCEFMASHGFVVVASNFEWPLGGGHYTNSTQDGIDGISTNIEFIMSFIQGDEHLDQTMIFAVGHSWGAQELVTFHSEKINPIRLIFSLHTTAEDKSENEILQNYEDLYLRLKKGKRNLSTRIIAFAPLQPKLNFGIFKYDKMGIYDFIVADQPMSHDGFISLGNLRMPFISKFQQVEQRSMTKQFASYIELANYIKNEVSNSHPSQYQNLWRFR